MGGAKQKEQKNACLSGRRIRLAEALDIPKETVYGLSCVTMIGDREIYIENYMSILEYTDKKLRLRVKGGNLLITGCRICILYFNDTDMQVRGCIDQIQFERR